MLWIQAADTLKSSLKGTWGLELDLAVLTTPDCPLGEPKPHLLQLEHISSLPIPCFLGEEIDPHLATASCLRVVEFGWNTQQQTKGQTNTFGVLEILFPCCSLVQCHCRAPGENGDILLGAFLVCLSAPTLHT